MEVSENKKEETMAIVYEYVKPGDVTVEGKHYGNGNADTYITSSISFSLKMDEVMNLIVSNWNNLDVNVRSDFARKVNALNMRDELSRLEQSES